MVTTTPTLRKTRDYKRFEIHDHNRDVGNFRFLEQSMRDNGFDPGFPVRCVNSGKKLRITAGHHRFHVAQKLGLPIWYVVSDCDTDLFGAERGNRQWNVQDYTTAYASAGHKGAKAIERYCKNTGIPLGCAIALVGGQSASSGNKAESLKDGSFEIGNMAHANAVADIVLFLTDLGIGFARNNKFVKAISRCLWVPCFDVDTFKRKAKTHLLTLEKCRTIDDYMILIDGIYNRGTRKQSTIALVHEANKIAHERMGLLHNRGSN